MSFPFRNRPSLRERLRGKSGDEIIKELRQEISQDRKMFFDNPNWASSPAGSAFTRRFSPEDVDDMMRGGGGGGRKLESQLDKIVERHPELAEELREWRRGGEEQRERLRNTVPDMATREEDRGQRASSAPPHHYAPPSRIDSQDEMRSHLHQQQEGAQTQEQPAPQPRVRHIPIFVEGREEPLLPREAQEGPPPAHHPIPAPAPPPPPPHQQPIPAPPPPAAPLAFDEPPTPLSPPQQPIPAPAPPPSWQTPPEKEEAEGASQPEFRDRAMETIAKVEEEVASLKVRVESWKGGSKSDKDYVFLDEMLTRNLLKLDDVDTEGREEVRSRRRHAIQSIQQCIAFLDTKTDPS